MLPRAVAFGPHLLHLVGAQTEQEEVVRPHRLADLHVRPVEGADGEGAVQGKLHVAGARGLLAGGRDLLGEVGRGKDAPAVLDVVVGQESHPEPLANVGVGVHHRGHGVDELDDALRHEVAGRRLPREDDRSRRDVQMGVGLQAPIEGDRVQHVEVLALVLVDALDLYVEEALGVDGHPRPLLDLPAQRLLVRELDAAPLGTEGGVLGQRLELPELFEVAEPAVPDRLGHETGEPGVDERHEAAWGDPVGDVADLARPEFVEVPQHVALQELGVEGCHAVDRVAPDAGQVGHAHRPTPALVDH